VLLETEAMIIGPGRNTFSRPGSQSDAHAVRCARYSDNAVGDGVMFARRVLS
jgi:hypothetical protein